MTEQIELKTNHNVRVVNLTTGQSVLCLFGDVRDETDENRVVGYRMLYPFTLTLGEVNEDGTIPIQYSRFCPFSPIEEHRLGCLLYTSPSPRDGLLSRMPSSA